MGRGWGALLGSGTWAAAGVVVAIACSKSSDNETRCTYGNQSFAAGDSFPARWTGEACPGTCVCESDGTVSCVPIECAGDSGGACTVDDTVYANGASVPASDGCNRCTCVNGSVRCTMLACLDGTAPLDGGADAHDGQAHGGG